MPGDIPKQLKKRTLANLSDQCPTRLRNAHAASDSPVRAHMVGPRHRCGMVEEDTLLSRWLAPDAERAAAWRDGHGERPRQNAGAIVTLLHSDKGLTTSPAPGSEPGAVLGGAPPPVPESWLPEGVISP